MLASTRCFVMALAVIATMFVVLCLAHTQEQVTAWYYRVVDLMAAAGIRGTLDAAQWVPHYTAFGLVMLILLVLTVVLLAQAAGRHHEVEQDTIRWMESENYRWVPYHREFRGNTLVRQPSGSYLSQIETVSMSDAQRRMVR